jgi:hypothetical protein
VATRWAIVTSEAESARIGLADRVAARAELGPTVTFGKPTVEILRIGIEPSGRMRGRGSSRLLSPEAAPRKEHSDCEASESQASRPVTSLSHAQPLQSPPRWHLAQVGVLVSWHVEQLSRSRLPSSQCRLVSQSKLRCDLGTAPGVLRWHSRQNDRLSWQP